MKKRSDIQKIYISNMSIRWYLHHVLTTPHHSAHNAAVHQGYLKIQDPSGVEIVNVHARFLSLIIILFLLISGMAGCIDFGDDGGDGSVPSTVHKPDWLPGRYWTYSFSTLEFDELSSKLVVAPDDGTNHLIGISTLLDARRHAVLNFNPILGRVKMDDMAIYEKGEPQLLFAFPLKKDSSWSFSLLDVEGFNAMVTDIGSADLPGTGKTTLVSVEAVAPSGEMLLYVYDTEAGWLRSLEFMDSFGVTNLKMTLVSLVSFGGDFSGEVYFVRGKDLYDGEHSSTAGSPVVEVYDSFVDSGHENYGDFDNLIYFLEVETGGGASGSVNLKDHTEESGLFRSFGPDSTISDLGTVPSSSGNWTVEINLEGNTYFRMRIAGGIEYIWNV